MAFLYINLYTHIVIISFEFFLFFETELYVAKAGHEFLVFLLPLLEQYGATMLRSIFYIFILIKI